jgi:hypothetical protein
MSKRRFVTGVLMAGAIASGGVAMASPAWASPAGSATSSSASPAEVGPAACSLNASPPKSSGSRLSGYGSRTGCGSTVTYFWVRVYEHIPWWPDGERAVAGATYFQNGGLTARGSCDGRGDYYTHVSTATGASGESRESLRNTIC